VQLCIIAVTHEVLLQHIHSQQQYMPATRFLRCQHCVKVKLTQSCRLHAAGVLHALSLTLLLLLLLLLGLCPQVVTLLTQLLMQRLQLGLLLLLLLLLLGVGGCVGALPVWEHERWLPVWCHGSRIFVQHANHGVYVREEGVAVGAAAAAAVYISLSVMQLCSDK
jgi:hypothetical protein